MVFEVALPFFGVTVTVTLQDPAFNPLSVVPETLQYFDEVDTTFKRTFEVESTLSLANVAIDFAEVALDIVTLGVITDVEFDPMTAPAGDFRVVDAGVETDVIGPTLAGDDATTLVEVKVDGTAGTPPVLEGDGGVLSTTATLLEDSCVNCLI